MTFKRIWLICLFLIGVAPAQSAVIYVKADSSGTSGTSWADACPSLQTALATAKPGDEIWVAKGTYRPTTGTDRTISFVIKDGVNVYGGFMGLEMFRMHRNWKANETILSGDIGTTDSADNSFRVVTGSAGSVLDGFTITGGNANGVHGDGNVYDDQCGAGMRNGTARNCVFINNRAAFYGGGMRDGTTVDCIFKNNASNYGGGQFQGTASGCIFIKNEAGSEGGGLYRGAAVNCVFENNTAHIGGGFSGQYVYYSVFTNNAAFMGGGLSGIPINCTIVGNTASYGGGIWAIGSTAMNSVFWNNAATTCSQGRANFAFCNVQNSGGSGANWDKSLGADGGGNIDADPEFSSPEAPAGPDGIWRSADDGLQLLVTSPCLNAGAPCLPVDSPQTDILGNPRMTRVTDMGAYENQTTVPMTELAVFDGDTQVTSSSLVNIGAKAYGKDLVKTLIVKNIGTADLVVSNTTASSPFRIDQAPSRILAPGTTSTLAIAMPAKVRGTYNGLISLESNDPLCRKLNFYVRGQVLVPVIKVTNINGVVIGNGGSIRVRSAGLNASVSSIQLTIKNIGDARLTLTAPAISKPFLVTGMPVLKLNPISSTTMLITMNTWNAGTFSNILKFATNDPNNPEFSVTVNGIVQDKPKVLYVKADSAATSQTANFGGSWATAYPDLEPALETAKPGNEIWIAAGTYIPINDDSYVMPEDVAIYGGFSGTETLREQRDWRLHKTTLNGDYGTSTDLYQTEHLIIGANGTLDGLTITKGRAWGARFMYGGGMLNQSVSPIIRNCVFSDNVAGESWLGHSGEGRGGAICNISSSVEIVNCIFDNNRASGCSDYPAPAGRGGAVYSDAASTTKYINCIFINNHVYGGNDISYYRFGYGISGDGYGGGMYSEGLCSVVNTVMVGNAATGGSVGFGGWGFGGAIFVKQASFINCILWNNSSNERFGDILNQNCAIQGCGGSGVGWKTAYGTDGGGNIASDPKFVNINYPAGPDGIWATADDGLRLRAGSSCIDGGTYDGASDKDILGQCRINRVDIGAFENRSRNAAGGWALYR